MIETQTHSIPQLNDSAEPANNWEPPAAPLDMPRQALECEAGASDWGAVLRLFRTRTRA